MHIRYKIKKDSRLTIQSVKINFPDRGETYDLPVSNQDDYTFHTFRKQYNYEEEYGNLPYTITVTDSGGNVATFGQSWKN